MGNTCGHFNRDHAGWFTNMQTSGACGIRNAFVLASIAASLSSVITTVSCVYINESLDRDTQLNGSSRKFLVALTTLVVGMAWSFFVYYVLYVLFGYGKAMIHSPPP